jgi:hypothetical protein
MRIEGVRWIFTNKLGGFAKIICQGELILESEIK